jgi:hypothetical protein
MRLRILQKLATEFEMSLLERAMEECFLEYEYRPKPAHMKRQILKIKEREKLKKEAAARRGAPAFKQLDDCKNNCVENEGVYRGIDSRGGYWEICDCLQAHWLAGGQRHLWMRSQKMAG